MRFRRYLGLHYQNPDNTYLAPVGKKKSKKQTQIVKPREIYCIYFLAYGLDLPKRPVLKVNYKVEDAYNGEEFPASGDFVTGLHHRSWIVQINELKKRRRNMLEQVLSVFDQSAMTNHRHILDVDDESFPEAYREIIRRLRKAMEDPKKRREMELEDDIINEIRDLERQVEEVKKEAEEKVSKAEKKAEKKVAEAEKKAEKKMTEAEKKVTEAEKKVTEAEKKVTEAEEKATEAEKKATDLQNVSDAQAKKIAELEQLLTLKK